MTIISIKVYLCSKYTPQYIFWSISESTEVQRKIRAMKECLSHMDGLFTRTVLWHTETYWVYSLEIEHDKEVFVKHEKVPTPPPPLPPIPRGIAYLVYAHVLENQSFWAFRSNSAMSKGTSTCQDISYEPIFLSLRPSVIKKQPEKAQVKKTAVFVHFGQVRPFPAI